MELFDKKYVYLEWDDVLEDKEVFVADCLADLRRRVDNNDHHGYSERVVDSCVEFPFRVYNGITFAMAYYDPLYEYKLSYNQGKKVEVYGFVGISRAWIEVTDDWKWEENYKYRVKPENVEKQEEPLEYITVLDKAETPPKVLVTPAVSSMPLSWHVQAKGNLERCKGFAVERFCKRCKHEVSLCCSPYLGCQGFKEAKEVADVDSGERSMWEPSEAKKRRKTNRELAKWLARGNGQAKNSFLDTITSRGLLYYECDDDKPCPDYFVIRGWDETEWSEPLIEE